MNSNRREIRSHHSIRGIAAVLVAVLHLQDLLEWGGIHLYSMTKFFGKGYLWVDCFFILSGFILSYVYGQTLQRGESSNVRSATLHFLRARFARIYPMHLFSLCLMLAIRQSAIWIRSSADGFFWGQNDWSSLLLNLFLMQSWETLDKLTWNQPSWSISTEAFAYLLFPVLCVLYARRRVTALVLFIAMPILGYSILIAIYGKLDQTFNLALVRCTSGFVLGMAIFHLWRLLDSAGRIGSLAVLQIPVVVSLVFAMHLGCPDALTVVLFSLLVLTTANDDGPVPRVLKGSLLVWLGMISYSVYMVHFPVIYLASEYRWFLFEYWVRHGLLDPRILSVIVFFVVGGIVLGVSTLTYRYVEVPARRRLSGRVPGPL